MKKKLLAIFFLIFISVEKSNSGSFESCSNASDIAESIMYARQQNADMIKVYNAGAKTLPDKRTKKTLMRLVQRAYKKRRYSTEKYKNNAIMDFKNKIFNECYSEK
ncbi:MAG: hypothetical protein KZQ83_14780 [gamma proteobacterium symbiont of Taylorina sp.]|nr:hypothetical protein [gamma proteobacterium symbiont of Taylorina sp.]